MAQEESGQEVEQAGSAHTKPLLSLHWASEHMWHQIHNEKGPRADQGCPCRVLVWPQHHLKQSQSCFNLQQCTILRSVGLLGEPVTRLPFLTHQDPPSPWALPVWAEKPLLSRAVLKEAQSTSWSAAFGLCGKNDKSYQKYRWDEKYEVFATSSCLGNRE